MKKILHLILFSFGFFGSPAQTSVYHPFPDSNATWNIHYVMAWACPGFTDLNAYYSYAITGDTIINSQTYHVITIPDVISNCQAPRFPGVVACIRQDTLLRKVFYVWRTDSVEHVLYDFNMSVGDTVMNTFMANCIVSSIDSILIGSNYRKQWHLNSLAGGMNLIEGIGPLNGMFEDCPCNMVDGPMAQLLCFRQNDQTLYPDTLTTCDLVTYRNEKSLFTREGAVSISPNPFHTTAKIGCCGGTHLGEKFQLTIYNSIGVLVREEKISNLNSYILHRDGLSDGLYFYELQTLPNLAPPLKLEAARGRSTGQALNSELIGAGKFVVE